MVVSITRTNHERKLRYCSFLDYIIFRFNVRLRKTSIEGSKLKYLILEKAASIEGQSLQTGKMINFSPERELLR